MAQTKKARPPQFRFWRAGQAKSQIFGVIALVLAILAVVLSLLGVFNTPISVRAGYVKQFNFQGRLTNPDGTNVDDGTYNMTFRIYSAATGGSALWTENHTGSHEVTVEDGVFNVNLGELNEIDLDFNSGAYYLGIEVNSDGEMTPRRRIGGVGYSLNTERVYGVPGSLTDTNIDSFPESERGILDALNYLNTSVIPAATLWTDTGSALRPKVGVSQDVSIPSGTLSVAGAVSFSSTLGVTSATTLSSTLAVTGAATMSSTLGVTGAATLSSTLAVTGASTLSGNVDAQAGLDVSGAALTMGSQNITGVGTNLTAATALTIGSTGATNDITLNSADKIYFQDALVTTQIPFALTDNTAAFETAFAAADRGVVDALISLASGGTGLWLDNVGGDYLYPNGTYSNNVSVSSGIMSVGTTPSAGRSINISNTSNSGYGVYTAMSGGTGTIYGNYVSVTNAATTNYGVYATVSGASAQNYAGYFASTLPSSPSGSAYGTVIATTSLGNAAITQGSLSVDLAAGYIGISSTYGIKVANSAVGSAIAAGFPIANYGVYSTTTAAGVTGVGIYTAATGASTGINYGLYSTASGASAQNYAGYFASTLDATPGTAAWGTYVTTESDGSEAQNQGSLFVALTGDYAGSKSTYGIYTSNIATSTGSMTTTAGNFGIHATSTGDAGAENIGVYGAAANGTAQNYAGYFVSTLDATPGAQAYGVYITAASTGTESQKQDALGVSLTGDYGGSSATAGIVVTNSADSTTGNFGVDSLSNGTGANNYGISALAAAATTASYGGKFTASGTSTNYGVYGTALNSTADTDIAGYFTASNATTAKYIVEMYNTGTNATSDALKISIATNPAGNTNTFIQFVDGSGNIGCVRGNTGAVQYQTTGEDFAEYFPRAEELSNGAVVSLRDDGKIKKAQPGEKPFGVISGTAGFAGGRDIPSNELVALVGQVAVDVTNEGGSISAGDTVTISSRAGFAKKVQAPSDSILGVALQSFTGREGQVKILISALSGILSASTGGDGDLINGGTINGNLGIKGELDVTGTIKATSLWSNNATWHIDSLGEAVFQKVTAGDIELQEGDNKALGNVTLPGNQLEVFVPNTSITAVSRIFLTIESTNDAMTGVKVKEKRAGQGFVISTLDGKVAPVDLPVDWLIIN